MYIDRVHQMGNGSSDAVFDMQELIRFILVCQASLFELPLEPVRFVLSIMA